MADPTMGPPCQYRQCPILLVIGQPSWMRVGDGESGSSCDGLLEILINIVTIAGEATLS